MTIFRPSGVSSSTIASGASLIIEFDCDAGASVGDLVVHSRTTDYTVEHLTSNVYLDLVIGVIIHKLSATRCQVRVRGVWDGATGLLPGRAVFVHTDGTPTSTPPLTGSRQIIGVAFSSTDFYVNPETSKVSRP